jgi:hypothetical protein
MVPPSIRVLQSKGIGLYSYLSSTRHSHNRGDMVFLWFVNNLLSSDLSVARLTLILLGYQPS